MMTTEPYNAHRKLKVFAVKDNLTNKFYQPVFVETDVEAKRWFEFVLNDNKIWKSNASCYDMWKIGEFDEKDGFYDMDKELFITGISVKKED